MARVQILLLKGFEEYRQCERIQKEIWGAHAVSSEILSVTQKYGGAVIGALVRNRVVGFIYAFLARRQGQLIHWSHMMGVEPRYRDLGIGLRMKLAHREFALNQGLRSICWTYDPLQSRNAALNIARLGAKVEEYIPDCYAEFPSLIEKSVPSDRFTVNWRIGSAAVEGLLAENSGSPSPRAYSASFSDLPRVNETRPNSDGFLENRKILLNLDFRRLLVEIPSNTDRMREESFQLAKRWRMETRKIFTQYFGVGYRVKGFIPFAADSRCFYLLQRGKP